MALPTVEELEAEMAALDAKRRAAAALLTAVRDYEAANANLRTAGATIQKEKSTRRHAPAMEATENVASELMEKRAAPVPTAEVVAEMKRRGMEVPTSNTNNIISARLSNSSKFEGRRGRGYWFADRPWPSSSSFDEILGGAPEDDPLDL